MTTENRTTTLSVGIPAHNEQATIGQLVHAIRSQHSNNYRLERIIIICDGCTDNTEAIVKNIALTDERVVVINDNERRGKASRLTQLYKLNESELLATFDADILPASSDELDTMVRILTAEPRCSVVAAHIEPVKPSNGFIATAIYTNYVLWNMVTNSINCGNHIHNIHGPASLLDGQFAKTVTYPENITCDEGYLYMMAKRAAGFRYAPNAVIKMNTVTSLREMRYGGSRILNERNDLVPYFGASVLNEYRVPIRFKVAAIAKLASHHPIYTLGAILYNLWIKFFSLPDTLNQQGLWRQTATTKRPIR